ncbi:hypothetical protein C4Q28_00205 [Pseudomonas sp. SWI6]|uniref:Uncharacterized protein n=1 Tax=Pseudomonas taiwanensis TaxID=470150 RepID=A0ABR6V6I4_9PSED|nr:MULTISPECIES: hypothetical protein [Pseudomonas]AGZ32959.1 hypothetical protein PVLB_00745 [Pseudomonas sp. VLB120]AVD80684.1 hypothetical protein C4Q28_00205 [Pseudomonas sp. SWI6]AVD87669.1 hypothetical protein C4Q26_11135 [Pseudomonas sp. SWI44]MBC3476119.1 hypothetical protein [Pseudomonas taiwanensis]MBC3490604.1 hypothetical protein [Pseudomonas taiwanensis]
MKAFKAWVVLMMGLAYQASALANETWWTAHIGGDGSVLRQWPKWIERVEHKPQDNYFTQYTLFFNKRIVHQDPGFCSVSPIDASSENRLVHGYAKVIGKPLAEQATVLTQLVDVKGPSGDNSMEFLVLCTR